MSIGHNFNLAIQSADDAHRYHMVTDNSSAAGSETYVDNPDTSLAFGHRKVLQCTATTANSPAELAVRLRAVESGGDPRSPDFEFWQAVWSSPTGPLRQAHTGSYYMQFRFRYQKGSSGSWDAGGARTLKILKIYPGSGSGIDPTSGNMMQIMVRNTTAAGNHFRLRLNTVATNYDQTGYGLSEDTTYDMRIEYKPSSGASDGVYNVWCKTASESSFTSVLAVSNHNQTSDIHWIGYGTETNNSALSSGDGVKVWHMDSYGRLDGFEADDYGYDRFRASTCLDVTGTTANIRVFCTDDMVNTTTGGFRVNYSTNPDVSLSTKTAYTDFSARVHDCAHIRITGLEPDTRYYYKIHFVDDTGSPVANYSTTEFRSFKTLATATGGTRRIHFMGCNHADGFSGNNQAIDELLTAETVPDFSVWQGDTFYDDAVKKLLASNDDYDLWDLDATELKNAYRLAYEEYDNNKLLSQTAHFAIWDDHDLGIDNADGNLRGQAVNMGLAVDNVGDPYSVTHVNPDYLNGGASPITAGDLFTLAHGVAAAWWGDGCEGEADGANGDYYRAITHGDVLIPILDTRTRSTSSALIPSSQRSWLESTVSGSAARFVLLSSQSVWGDWVANAGFPENWGSNSNTRSQRNSIFDWLKTNASNKIIYGVGNDRHAPYMATLSGTAVDGCLKYEVNASPAKSYRWYDTSAIAAMNGATGVLDVIDTADYGENTMVRTSGAMLTINEATGQFDVVMYDDFGNKLIDQSHTYPTGGGSAMRFWNYYRRRRLREEQVDE